jgi:phenylalanine-4-hydroxylase
MPIICAPEQMLLPGADMFHDIFGHLPFLTQGFMHASG